MDRVKYLSNQTTAQNGQYPVTIQGLEFIQRQIMTLQKMCFVGGDYFVIAEPTDTAHGSVVFDGEIMPLVGPPTPTGYIAVETTFQSIHTDSGDYTSVREIRSARYTQGAVGVCRERRLFKEWRPNTELWEKLSVLIASGLGLPVEKGIFNSVQLDERRTPARLIGLAGSSHICGYSTFAVDVYALDGDGAYQELRGSDFRRWGRYYNAGTKVWGTWQPISDQMTIEVKVTSAGVKFRHSFLPPYVSLVMLRKKTRSRHSGLNRPARPAKNAWYNSWKMQFSQGEPNTWYMPKCLTSDFDFSAYVGRYFHEIVRDLLLIRQNVNGYTTWRIAGVHRNWKKRPFGYAKIALGIVTSTEPNVPPISIARLRFRVSHRNKYGYPVSTFTVE